jgi:AsmA protein
LTLFRSKRRVIIAGTLLLLALFLVRPGAGWLRGRLIRNVSVALGRAVDIQSVSIRLLPQPGFEMGNFVVYDDPAFGAEPIVRAGEVTAVLRLTSLLRGHLDIASLSLSEPSLNLARDNAGHWNLEDILTRAAQTPVAPTRKPRTEKRLGFPYIEADHARINFKLGQEKTPYALTNADFTLWQESENSWGMRLKAQPVRTDFNLTDTGVLNVSGTWRRAAMLRETPLKFSVQWEGAQLGQATKLASGNDKGWRGTISLSATLSGRPAELLVTSAASVQDFRRYDVMRDNAIRLASKCDGLYSSVNHTLAGIQCQSAVGEGSLALSGNMAEITGSRTYDLKLTADRLPAEAIAALLRHASARFPDDLHPSGSLNAHLTVQKGHSDSYPAWTGGGEASDLQFSSGSESKGVVFGRVPFSVVPANVEGATPKRGHLNRNKPGVEVTHGAHIEAGPFELALGKTNAVTIGAWASPQRYSVSIAGNAQVQPLLEIARTFHVPVLQPSGDGRAQFDLQMAGAWSDARPKIIGKAQLQQVRAEIRGVNAPLQIETAALAINENTVDLRSLSATVGKMTWHGTVSIERQRAADSKSCRNINFDLRADELSTDELNELLNPHVRKRPWYRFLEPSPDARAPFLLTACASGKFAANHVSIHHLPATHVSGRIDLAGGKVSVSGLLADVLGGKHVGVWQADFTAKPPEYSGSGVFQHVSLQQLATAMHDGWVSGTGNGSYRVKASGLTSQELVSSAEASLDVNAHDAFFPHLTLAGASGMKASQLNAHLLLSDGKLNVDEGKLESQGSIYQLSGTASLSRKLDLKLIRDNTHSFNITGTLAEPHVQPGSTAEARAALKP